MEQVMAHPETPEAVDAPVPVTDESSAAAALANLFGADAEEGSEDEEQNSEPEAEGEPDEGDLEPEGEDEVDEQDEPEAPAIVPPVSLNADEKAKFERQPPEAQQLIMEIETRRNAQVQEATTKASAAQREAESRAAIADAQAKAVYAQQLKVFADALAPQMPDIALSQTDPATYVALRAQYDAAQAQHAEFVQQVQALGQEAESTLTETEVAQRDRELLAIPEVQNEDTRNTFFEKSIGAAKTLGLDLSGLNSATAKEWQALRQVADAFEKASKYDAAMARQMQRVREGKKGKTARPNAAQPMGTRDQRFTQSVQRLRETGSVDDAASALRNILG